MKMLLWRLRNAVFRLVRPAFWAANYRVDWAYDAALRRLLASRPEIKWETPGYTVLLGGLEVWVNNYPYSYGYSRAEDSLRSERRLPSPITRRDLLAYVKTNLPPPKPARTVWRDKIGGEV